MKEDWEAKITGTIKEIRKENLDKSGNNPKWKLHLVMEPDSVLAPDGVTLSDTPELAGWFKSLDVDPGDLAEGDKISVDGVGNGIAPDLLQLKAVRKHD